MQTATQAFTHHQSTFVVHRMTLERVGDDALAQSLSTTRVDINLHKVDAAFFAYKSLFSKGAIFGDGSTNPMDSGSEK